MECGGSETFGLAMQIVWGVDAETFAFDAALEGGGIETECTSDAAYVYPAEMWLHKERSLQSIPMNPQMLHELWADVFLP
ncbi:hypothetical protein F2Q69_00063612 [Brassica cretica]|uniref:Uncharacterized protein n=1 Tax=Brassica cretica TaxID=69181 RepID=A0A8S9RHQ8_BRACR|nr:hypothetical protein F2Q69_00063612 [Brassica cretica]